MGLQFECNCNFELRLVEAVEVWCCASMPLRYNKHITFTELAVTKAGDAGPAAN